MKPHDDFSSTSRHQLGGSCQAKACAAPPNFLEQPEEHCLRFDAARSAHHNWCVYIHADICSSPRLSRLTTTCMLRITGTH